MKVTSEMEVINSKIPMKMPTDVIRWTNIFGGSSSFFSPSPSFFSSGWA